jgi:hypothetical protein
MKPDFLLYERTQLQFLMAIVNENKHLRGIHLIRSLKTRNVLEYDFDLGYIFMYHPYINSIFYQFDSTVINTADDEIDT